jgi:hypothetical protein
MKKTGLVDDDSTGVRGRLEQRIGDVELLPDRPVRRMINNVVGRKNSIIDENVAGNNRFGAGELTRKAQDRCRSKQMGEAGGGNGSPPESGNA